MAASDAGKPPIWDGLVWLHRWTGIAVCLLVALWFGSGIVMLYEPFPSLPAAVRYQHAEQFAAEAVQIAPAAVVGIVPGTTSVDLLARDGRPVYIATNPVGKTIVDAATGQVLPSIDSATAERIATHFSGFPVLHSRRVEFDQWIVHEAFAAHRPYYRVAMNDTDRSVLYVSAATGEVRQRTTRRQRLLNSAGAVPHWLYWTAIRKHWGFWDTLVWWVSLVAVVSASLGVGVGVYRFVQSRRRGGSGWKVFASWWRWHHVLGLTAGVFLLGWIVSGWLSMDHGRLFSRGNVPDEVNALMAGAAPGDIAAAIGLPVLHSLGQVAEVNLRSVSGRPFVVAHRGNVDPVIVTLQGERLSSIPDAWLLAGMRAAFPGEPGLVRGAMPVPDLYARAEELPASARLFMLHGPPVRRAYADAVSGRVLAIQDPGRRAYAWLYYALHTYRLQVFVGRDSLRTSLMLLPLLAGLALSVTGAVIGWRRLRLSTRR